MQRFLLSLFLLSTVSFAVTSVQTDWSGGGGVPGPVTDWGSSYYSSSWISSTGGSLQLMPSMLATPIEHVVDGNYDGAHSVYAADVDGDGDMDVLGVAYNANEVTWWENTNGSGTSWIEHTVDSTFSGAQSVYATDVDGDGDTDVLGAARVADDITWWENTDGSGTSWTEHTVDGSFDGANTVYAADVDGDGDTDVLGAADIQNDITWWENTDGTGTSWTEHTVDGNFSSANSVYATDVDGDGDMDVLGAATSADDIAWWENTDGSGTSWTEHTVDGNFNGAIGVYATDMNGDGYTDVLGVAFEADDITWWENTDGSGTSWTEHTVDGSFNGAYSVYATDVDGDGDTDALGTAFYANDITWWENTDGAGTSWTEHTVDGDFDMSHSVYATDVNGDGCVDVLGAAWGPAEIAWWNLTGYSAAGTLESSILDAGTVEYWDIFACNHMEPAGTSLCYQFRSSQDSSSMGAWSDTVFTSISLAGVLADSTDFLQYRVILQTTDPQNTPVLSDLMFSYTTYVSVADNNEGEIVFWGLVPSANPSFGNLAVQVSTPQPGMVDLVLHDAAGRVVARYSQNLPGGTHAVTFNNLSQGVYFCTMHSGDFSATERIVVLK
ncbi:MAG: T9SS type A sorting domain-containing protein [Candidatus Sabulitectum sp.]|nr:T9SS type A sorting domain-containing protein [Candidatus Sabulitectum sp.]